MSDMQNGDSALQTFSKKGKASKTSGALYMTTGTNRHRMLSAGPMKWPSDHNVVVMQLTNMVSKEWLGGVTGGHVHIQARIPSSSPYSSFSQTCLPGMGRLLYWRRSDVEGLRDRCGGVGQSEVGEGVGINPSWADS